MTNIRYVRRPLKPQDRFRVFEKDGFACRYCGQSAPSVILHVDHILPVSKGGSNHPDNLCTACSACNAGKSTSEVSTPILGQRDLALTAMAIEAVLRELGPMTFTHRMSLQICDFVCASSQPRELIEAVKGTHSYAGVISRWLSMEGFPDDMIGEEL